MRIHETWKLYLSLWRRPNLNTSSLLERFDLIRRLGRIIIPEYKFKWPQMDWWNDEEFNSYLKLFDEADGNNTDRRYAVAQLLRIAPATGDTAEVGVWRGAMSWLICCAGDRRRMHHIFDSFEGLSSPISIDGGHWQKGDLACDEKSVHANLSEFAGSFRTYKGWVPQRFAEIADREFAFVHIDVDLYQPTIDSLSFFYPRMVPGGIIVCDDWGFSSCPGATKACELFLSDKPEKMVGLSAGAGFMIKGMTTSAAAAMPHLG
jgi:O-methyltransferase